jgi:hypothetical protein
MNNTVVCSVCGKSHRKSESELFFQRPDVVHVLSEEERENRCKSTSDAWMLDGERFFLRGLLPLPVRDESRRYNIGVWAEVSREVFTRVNELWIDPAQSAEPRMPAALANELPLVSDTLGLSVAVQLTGPSTRPEYYVATTEHPLYSEQGLGISAHRALEYSDSTNRGLPSNKSLEQTREG